MDLSNFQTYDKKESLLLSIAKSNQEIVENTHAKLQETLEVKKSRKNLFHLIFHWKCLKMDDGSNKFRNIQHYI